MIVKSYSRTTKEISQKQIWALISDVNHWNIWDNTVEYSELIDSFQTGFFFILKPKGSPKVKIKLSKVIPCSYFKDETRFPLAKMYGEHLYEYTDSGLKITITMTMTGILSFLWYKLVMKDIVNNLEEDIRVQIAAAKKLTSI